MREEFKAGFTTGVIAGFASGFSEGFITYVIERLSDIGRLHRKKSAAFGETFTAGFTD